MVGRIGFKNYKIRAIESVYIFNNIMDYCNGSLVGLPASTFGTLEFILHTEATVTLSFKRSHCAMILLKTLRWFFFSLWVKLKIPITATKLQII